MTYQEPLSRDGRTSTGDGRTDDVTDDRTDEVHERVDADPPAGSGRSSPPAGGRTGSFGVGYEPGTRLTSRVAVGGGRGDDHRVQERHGDPPWPEGPGNVPGEGSGGVAASGTRDRPQWPVMTAPGHPGPIGWPGDGQPPAAHRDAGAPGDHGYPPARLERPVHGRPGEVGWPSGSPSGPDRLQPSAAPAARRGSWRTYVVVAGLVVLVAAGLGGLVWKSRWLRAGGGERPAPRTVAVVPPAEPPSAAPSPSASVRWQVNVVDPGTGTFLPVTAPGPVLGTTGTLRRFHVQVEGGINEDPDAFAEVIDQTLGDPRSWIAGGQFRLQRVPAQEAAEFTVFLASPTTSAQMCAAGGLQTDKFTSCRIAGKVIINDARWLTAIPDYGAPLDVYRQYAINHEVGHQLGHGHEACPGPGRAAPVMQQQTYGLKGCVANPWPFVDGARYAGPPIPGN